MGKKRNDRQVASKKSEPTVASNPLKPSTRLLSRPIGALPADFRSRLSPKVQAILADHERHGGNPAFLLGLLYQLFEDRDPTDTSVPRSFKTMLQRCKRDLTALLDFRIDMVRSRPLNLRFSAGQTVKAIDDALRILGAKRTRGRPKAPSGATTDSLVVAVLAEEFTRLYGQPRYDWISTLVQSAAPGIFLAEYSTEKHLRQRANTVPPSALQALLTNEFRAFLSTGAFAGQSRRVKGRGSGVSPLTPEKLRRLTEAVAYRLYLSTKKTPQKKPR